MICVLLLCIFICTNIVIKLPNASWRNQHSNPFLVSNGIKQGGVLYTILFSVYLDEQVGHLAKSKVGSHAA